MSSLTGKTPSNLDQLSAVLAQSYQGGPRAMHHIGGYELPQQTEVEWCIETVRALLLPGFVGAPLASENRATVEAYVRERLENLQGRLCAQLYRGLHHRCAAFEDRTIDCVRCAEKARVICTRFLEALPDLRTALATDVEAAYEGDPAATGTDEVIFCYPGLYAITCYRMAHRLLCDGASIIPRMITEHAHEKTGIDIHPGATIGKWFFIDHGTGIVIGETTSIGERVRIYQGVTLGALSLPKGKAHGPESPKRHPTIEDDVIIYANATILGGQTVIGRAAVIGGNCWVTASVAPGARLTVEDPSPGVRRSGIPRAPT
jgi:serine O-acetyltransferase